MNRLDGKDPELKLWHEGTGSCRNGKKVSDEPALVGDEMRAARE